MLAQKPSQLKYKAIKLMMMTLITWLRTKLLAKLTLRFPHCLICSHSLIERVKLKIRCAIHRHQINYSFSTMVAKG